MAGVAVITGASRGIGAATARLAAASGYDVCVNYVSNRAAAERVVADCAVAGVRAAAVQADVGLAADVERLFAACDAALGAVTLLVNNAGIIGAASEVAALDDAALERTFAVNTLGAIRCARAALARMGPVGAIVNVSSVAATLGSPGEYVHYAASKAALDAFTVGLAKEVGRRGIRVNAVQAGTADTEIHAASGNPGRPAMVARTAPLGRVATAEEIAEAVIWLASAKAGYVTGAILRVGGGL